MSPTRQPQIVITGGQGVLARAICARFASENWLVHAPGRDELDVTIPEAVESYFSRHHPDLLICNAGVIRDAPIAKLRLDDWQHAIDVNFHGARRCAISALTRMQRRESGHIVFISSHSAIHPPVGQAAYAAAKAALLGLTRDLAAEAGTCNVRVNAILPGFLKTTMTTSVSEKRREKIRNSHLLGRFNTPDAVAKFISHLQQELPHTSGQVFQLDSRIG